MEAKGEDGTVVQLNVGGVHYSVARATLLSRESMLAAMFGGRHTATRTADGRCFIDRDGVLFRYILQYLRDSDLEMRYLDFSLRGSLKREAAYFCLSELERKLDASLRLPRTVSLKCYMLGKHTVLHGIDPMQARLPPHRLISARGSSTQPCDVELTMSGQVIKAEFFFLDHVLPSLINTYSPYYRLVSSRLDSVNGPSLYIEFEQL